MRKSPIRDLLSQRGARFVEKVGVEIAAGFSSFEEEYRAVRDAVGLADFSFTSRFQIPESGLDVLERYTAGAVAGIRFGRVMHTFAVDEAGLLESDLYIANDDENFIVMGESLIGDNKVTKVLDGFGGAQEGLKDLSSETALFSLDGFKAWAVAKDLFGQDVLGLPYLSIETYEIDGTEVKLVRGGKTSEFGYLLQVPAEKAAAVWEKIERAGEQYGLKCVGLGAHMALRLDGRFFNIHKEGAAVRDPLPLGLQWMIDFDGDDFRGKDAIMERRAAGLEKKIIGIVPDNKTDTLEVDEKLQHQGQTVAEVVSQCASPALDGHIGLALFDIEYAYSGLEFETPGGRVVKTVSMPPFTPKSLTVKLDEM